jgi:hypothetical protein
MRKLAVSNLRGDVIHQNDTDVFTFRKLAHNSLANLFVQETHNIRRLKQSEDLVVSPCSNPGPLFPNMNPIGFKTVNIINGTSVLCNGINLAIKWIEKISISGLGSCLPWPERPGRFG